MGAESESEREGARTISDQRVASSPADEAFTGTAGARSLCWEAISSNAGLLKATSWNALILLSPLLLSLKAGHKHTIP